MIADADLNSKQTYIIGIGASAGGLEALQSLFLALDEDTGHSFVVVQHLSPDFKSLMPELLSRKTNMEILSVETGITPKKNTIYLLPPRCRLTIHDAKFKVKNLPNSKELFLPIDEFFISLAKDQGEDAIGVVLSGTGTDGSRGIEAIAKAGGAIFVQDPESAKFDGMPMAALATGLVIESYLPKEIGHKLRSPFLPEESSDISIEQKKLSKLFDVLFKYTNIDFHDYKTSTISRQLARRMNACKIASLDDYVIKIIQNKKELEILKNSLLIGVTRFFRDAEAFTYLQKEIIPKIILETSEKSTIRIWSAGCSSGEEPYSLAIAVFEAMDELGVYRDLRIFATDADERSIAKAGFGIYPKSIVEDVSKERLERFFIEMDDHYQLSPRIRRSVLFARHNVPVDPPFSNIDLVVCRNMLIYFIQNMQRRVIGSLSFALRLDGYMFLGSSEALGAHSNHFEVIHDRYKIYRKISNENINHELQEMNSSSGISAVKSRLNLSYQKSITDKPKTETETSQDLDDLHYNFSDTKSIVVQHLISAWVPPTILIDSLYRAIYSYGDTSDFTCRISNGRISNDIRTILQPSLSQVVLAGIDKSKTNDVVIYRDLRITKVQNILPNKSASEKTEITYDIRLECLQIDKSKKFVFLLSFLNIRYDAPELNIENKSVEVETFSEQQHLMGRITNLEDELFKSQEHLQITVEELETTNEELQASNEELMSANEELQSTNEELHSLNEELYTVNSEYQEKISQLSHLNDDYNNILNVVNLGIILLDEIMIIRKFTRELTKYFSILDEDVGRPIHHFSHILDYPELLTDIAKVFEQNTPIRKTVPLIKPIEETSVKPLIILDKVHLEILPYVDSNKETAGTVLVVNRINRSH